MKKYDIILADPPWYYNNKATRASADKHYPTMKFGEIATLPIEQITKDRAVLFLWATWPNIKVAFKLIDYWGFVYKTLAWDWWKTNKAGDKFIMGLGNYSRANPEPCLLAFMGKPFKVADHSVKSWIISPRQKHSQKPFQQYKNINRLYPNLNDKIELFARDIQPGWDVWGNEVKNDIELELI